ncbi:MAG: hypothetical protein ACT4NV_12310 [Rhodoferax sp.]
MSATAHSRWARRMGAHLGAHFSALKGRLGQPLWLLLGWDVGGLSGAVVDTRQGSSTLLAQAQSRQARFAPALDEVLRALAQQGAPRPRRVALAARHLVPVVLPALPVQPDKPRPAAQMRELLQADLEPALAEFGSLWSLGGLLQARGYLSAPDRERVSLEESVRRQNRASQLRYGEIAMELGLIERAALDECLDLQASLQNLDAQLAAGWRGRMEDKQALWLACGVGQTAFDEWQDALRERALRLDAALPLAWLASASTPPASTETRRESWRVDLELHAEELVAVQRRNGRVLAARSQGRVEHALSSDTLHRLIADWCAESRVELQLHCLHPLDDEGAPALAQDLGLLTGHPCACHASSAARQALWAHLLRQAQAAASELPRIAPAELRGHPLKDPDLRRMLALGGVLLALLATEGVQRYRLTQLEQRMAQLQRGEKERASTQQLTQQANQHLLELSKNLDQARRALEPVLAERARLGAIVAMRRDLPELMYQLAKAVGTDAVMEEIHNDSTQNAVSAIQVVAWSPSYTGAQDFSNRMAVLARDSGYGVSQTEIKERAGRDGRKGHEVRFWLLYEDNELESPQAVDKERAAPTNATPGGISAKQP